MLKAIEACLTPTQIQIQIQHTHTYTDRMAHMLTDKSARHMDRHEERMKAIRESGILNTMERFTTFLKKIFRTCERNTAR